jgi:hypothetical protein
MSQERNAIVATALLMAPIPDKHIIVFEDNFHLLEMPGYGKDAGEAKVAASSHFMKQLCTSQQVTVLATMELPKSALERGKRPYYTNVKGTGAIPYDINANTVLTVIRCSATS